MIGRGELLELMHTSDVRWETLHARGLEWRHLGRSTEAWRRHLPPDKKSVTYSGAATPEETTEPWELWFAKPDRIRTKFRMNDTVTAVIKGDWWWSWSETRKARTNRGDTNSSHGLGPGDVLLNGARALPVLSFDAPEEVTFADRPAIAVRAVPTQVEPASEDYSDWVLATHFLGSGADEYRLVVDAERGVLLRTEAQIAGAPFRIVHVDEILFDQTIDDETFVPPDGDYETIGMPRYVPISELSQHVPFTVLVPERPPVGVEDAQIHPEEGASPLQVVISYASMFLDEDHLSFSLVEAAEPLGDRRGVDWRESDGMRYGDDHDIEPPLRVVRLERAGTHVELHSFSYSLDVLRDLARILVPLD